MSSEWIRVCGWLGFLGDAGPDGGVVGGGEVDVRCGWAGVFRVPEWGPYRAWVEEREVAEQRVDLGACPVEDAVDDGVFVHSFDVVELGDHVLGDAVIGEMGDGEVGAGRQQFAIACRGLGTAVQSVRAGVKEMQY